MSQVTTPSSFDLRIIVGSHNFCVDSCSLRARKVVMLFASRFASYTWENVYGEMVKVLDRVYASSADQKREFRFHINTLNDFNTLLQEQGIEEKYVERVIRPMYEPVRVDVQLRKNWKNAAREHQVPQIDYLANEKQVSRFLGAQTGTGKALSLNSLIKVPGGWKTMGEMKVGDKVIARDGSQTNVIGVFPQGEVLMYKVTFSDGRSVEACGEHLWRVYYVNTSVNQRWKTVDTLEMLRLISMPNPRVYIPLCEPEQDEDVELPIAPYSLGALLGDGGLSHVSVNFAKTDVEVLEELKNELPASMQLVSYTKKEHGLVIREPGGMNVYRTHLKAMGLQGCRSWEKFIPEQYIKGSSSQRLALLQGLMDTDGTADEKGTVSFCSTSQQLAEGVIYLVRSLGGIATLAHRTPSYSYKGQKLKGRPAYQVNIRMKKPSDLFRLPRKKERCNDQGQYNESLKLRVSSIEFIGKKAAQCISVDHPESLYITNNFVVTHNTMMACTALARIMQRVAIIVQPRYMVKWQEDLLKMYDITPEDIMHVSGSQSLKKLLVLAKEGRLDVPFIIISSKTFQNYIKAYVKDGAAMMEDGWEAVPPHFFEAIGAGQRLIDEVHQEFHLMFTVDLYTHIPGSISLSATLIHNDAFIRRMHATMFPVALRCVVPELIRYIDAFAVHAMFDRVDKLRTSERGGRGYYSHNALERSIIGNKKVLANYLKFVEWMARDGFDRMKREKKALIIFASTVEMCTIIRDHFRKLYPDLTVERYVGTMKDPYDNLIKPDIRVTTLGSGGTAHDIPNLTNAILTICVDSAQANVQSLGRLRQLGEGETVFHYVVYDDIPKTVDYHKGKKEMLKVRARTVNDLFPGFIL